MGRGRAAIVGTLVVVASLALGLALAAAYVRIAIGDSGQFANRATTALSDPSVRSLIAERVTDELVLKGESDLIAARPLIESVVSSAVGSRAFTGAFRSGVRDLHRAVVDRDQDTVTLTVADVGTIVAGGLQAVRPALAERVEAQGRVELVRERLGSVGASAAHAVRTIEVAALALALLALAGMAGAVWLSRDRRRTVVHLGVGAAVAGAILVVALGVGGRLVADRFAAPGERAAARAVWDAFAGDLVTAAWILAAAGAVVAATAASLIRPVDVDEPLRRAARRLSAEPARPAGRVLRGALLVALGVLFILDRDAVLRVLFTAAGLYLVFIGVSAIVRVAYAPRDAREEPPERPSRRRPLVATVLAGGAIAAAVAVFLGTGGVTTAAPAGGPCNGHDELCDRTLPEVVLPATHNSMSAPLPGWFSSEQDTPIGRQVRDGIRGLLIDTHYADRLPDGRLRTEVGDLDQLRRQAEQDGVSPSAIDSALRVRARLGFSGEGRRGMYLCHSFCELGGTPLADVLDDLHDFLVANPNEVLVVINQDYVEPRDFVGAVRDAGLERFVFQAPAGGAWPTLREMIDSGRRILFTAENHAGAAAWYQLAYAALTQETPYAFSKAAQLTDPGRLAASCRPNRGPAEAPLFLVNHWITTDPVPLPSNAARVNVYARLLARLRECRRIRDRLPNLVAVNFYRRGDLFRAVDALNGV